MSVASLLLWKSAMVNVLCSELCIYRCHIDESNEWPKLSIIANVPDLIVIYS
ncbi:hypothetical protein LMG33818_000138 [Halomonadaceae bacterium LMG 33818]